MVRTITPEELREKLNREKSVQIVDIRPSFVYEGGHIPGSNNIPLNDLTNEISEYEWGGEIIIVCSIGESSVQAARLFESYMGVKQDAYIASLEGGFQRWKRELSQLTPSNMTDDWSCLSNLS